MTLLIIRHGESQADLLNVHEGRADFELTARGHKQAQAAAEYMKNNYSLSAICCSPLKRAYQTAEYIAKAFGLPLLTDERLMEFNNGLIAGMDRETAARKYPKQEAIPLHASVYEQESELEFRFRADYALSRMLSEYDENATVAIVTHGGTINRLYHSFLRLPVDCGIAFATGDTGIHEWRVLNGRRIIVCANRTEHTYGI